MESEEILSGLSNLKVFMLVMYCLHCVVLNKIVSKLNNKLYFKMKERMYSKSY